MVAVAKCSLQISQEYFAEAETGTRTTNLALTNPDLCGLFNIPCRSCALWKLNFLVPQHDEEKKNKKIYTSWIIMDSVSSLILRDMGMQYLYVCVC